MPALSSFDYAVVRLVPSVQRAEFLNVGVVLFCRQRKFLEARLHFDKSRFLALAPQADPLLPERVLRVIPLICAGGEAAGPYAQLDQSARFHYLVSPSSTLVQTSPVHCGLCADPKASLDALFAHLVV